MKTDQIFIGDIKKCTKYETHTTFSTYSYFGDQCIGGGSVGYIEEETELYKKNAILIKVRDNRYVDLEQLNSILNYIKIFLHMVDKSQYLGELIMPTCAYYKNSLFVDEKSLKPYYNDNLQISDISVRKLKQQTRNIE